MERKTAFIGHRQVCFIEKVKERLQNAIEQCINDGCSHFLMGAHGDFDQMALNACRSARKNTRHRLCAVSGRANGYVRYRRFAFQTANNRKQQANDRRLRHAYMLR